MMKKILKVISKLFVISKFLFSTALIGNGGVLPYIRQKDDIYFLLIRKITPSRWSTLRGESYKNETAAQTAARESSNQLMHIVSYKYLFEKINKTKFKCGNIFIINISDLGNRREIINRLGNAKQRRLNQNHQSLSLFEKNEFRWFSKGRLIKAIQQNEWWLDKKFKNRFKKCLSILNKLQPL